MTATVSTIQCPAWCEVEGDHTIHLSEDVEVDGPMSTVRLQLSQDAEGTILLDVNGQVTDLEQAKTIAREIEALANRATPADPAATRVIDTFAEMQGTTTLDLAAELGIDLEIATMADLNRIGRVLGERGQPDQHRSVGLA